MSSIGIAGGGVERGHAWGLGIAGGGVERGHGWGLGIAGGGVERGHAWGLARFWYIVWRLRKKLRLTRYLSVLSVPTVGREDMSL